MVGVDFPLDGISLIERFTVEMLITISPAQRFHIPHPEVIIERTDETYRLFEAMFDFESKAIESNDVNGVQGEIGAHQQAASS